MGLSTLNGHRVTSARVTIPAWGCWYAEVKLDGEHALTGAVTLKIADATYVGAVLSGGASLGRSAYRIVGGAGGWGLTIPEKPYANDAQVKFATVIGDAAAACGETVATIASTQRTGPGYVRQGGPASDVLNLLAPGAWYVDEAGVTHLGARASSVLPANVVRINPTDRALGMVVLASESIVGILPGVVVDGMTAVDVTHEVSVDGGLRSTVWGSSVTGALDSLRGLSDALDPRRAYRGVTEFRVGAIEGNRLGLQPVRVSSGLPILSRVPMRPGVSGCYAEVALGSRVLVGFIDSDPGRPYVASFEEIDGEAFSPVSLRLDAGGMAGGERVMTTEATALLIYNTLAALMTAAGDGPLLAAVLQPLIGAAVNAALAAQSAPAPPTEAAQVILAATLLAGFATGAPSNTSAFFSSAISAGSTKTANDSGLFPGIGSKAVEIG